MNQISRNTDQVSQNPFNLRPDHARALVIDAPFNYSAPKDLSKDVWLLTIMGVVVRGKWLGHVGEYFIGWTEHEPRQRS